MLVEAVLIIWSYATQQEHENVYNNIQLEYSMEKELPRLNINLYQTHLGDAILVSAVSENTFGNVYKEGAYESERVFSELLDFSKKYGLREFYLRSSIPQEPGRSFRTVENSFLSQIGDSLKKQGLETKVILNEV